MREEKKPNVNIHKAGNGYIVVVWDEHTRNQLALTREELDLIVLYGRKILEDNS
jgi:diadenosine tetraphosphate (Ap4A) HIT family hydrolase